MPTHVLRFWESKFTQVKPVKRAGGRRYYRPSDMLLIGGIKKLLHDDGLTIRGVQKICCANMGLSTSPTVSIAGRPDEIDDGSDVSDDDRHRPTPQPRRHVEAPAAREDAEPETQPRRTRAPQPDAGTEKDRRRTRSRADKTQPEACSRSRVEA